MELKFSQLEWCGDGHSDCVRAVDLSWDQPVPRRGMS